MAGNMIVIGSKFKPFSYDEMIKPIQVADAEHKALEGEMGELSTRAGVFEKLANEQTDPEAYAMYKQYSTDLASQAESLAKSGLTPDSRTALSKMRQRYSQEITPIEQAYKRRDELTKEQREAMLKDPTLMMSQAASTLSLDDLIKNPNLSYQAYSGNMLTQQAAQAARELAKYQQEKPREWRKILGGQYFESMMNRGYTPEQVIMAAMDDPNAPKELKKIADDVYASSGIDTWGDDITKQRAKEFIGRGLYSAIGDTQYQQVQNQEYLDPLQRAKLAAAQGDNSNPRLGYRPVPRTTVKDAETTQLQDEISFLQQVKENPDILKEEAEREVRNEARAYGATWGSYGTKEKYQPNREKLKRITDKYGTTDPDFIIQKAKAEIKGAAIRDFTYSTNLADNSLLNDVVTQNLATMAIKDKIPAYEFKDGKKGKQLESDELAEIKPNSGHLDFDPQSGNLVYVYRDKKDKLKKAVLDPEVVDDKNRTLRNTQQLIEEAKEKKDYASMSLLIDFYMSELDGKFNTLAKTQGKTDSKLFME